VLNVRRNKMGYVNIKGSEVSPKFKFERVLDGASGEWDEGTPAWDIKYTWNGYDYESVGVVTAFTGDGVKATIEGYKTISGKDPFTVFEEAVKEAEDFNIEDFRR
jgi:hypothetical protein